MTNNKKQITNKFKTPNRNDQFLEILDFASTDPASVEQRLHSTVTLFLLLMFVALLLLISLDVEDVFCVCRSSFS